MVFILELIGTVAFAFSGCMVANSKKMDIFGVWVLGTVTAVGGGAVRDVLLGIFPPNMFRHGSYVAVATLTVALWLLMAARNGTVSRAIFKKLTWIMDISDSIGLGIFAVVGSQTAINVGYGDNWFLVIFVGVMTGVGGGLLRDVMANMTADDLLQADLCDRSCWQKPDLCSDGPDCPGADRGDHRDRNRVYHPDSGECQKMGSSGIRVRTENKIKVQIRT